MKLKPELPISIVKNGKYVPRIGKTSANDNIQSQSSKTEKLVNLFLITRAFLKLGMLMILS
jgi:hypothetical protein